MKQAQLTKTKATVDAQYSIFSSSELYKMKLDLLTQYNLLSTNK